jgi:hypothetical protein
MAVDRCLNIPRRESIGQLSREVPGLLRFAFGLSASTQRSETSTGLAILPAAARENVRHMRFTSTGFPGRTSRSTATCIAERSSSRNS